MIEVFPENGYVVLPHRGVALTSAVTVPLEATGTNLWALTTAFLLGALGTVGVATVIGYKFVKSS
jgi:hypothetical protein